MTEEEKKEFEEFLKWKAERNAKKDEVSEEPDTSNQNNDEINKDTTSSGNDNEKAVDNQTNNETVKDTSILPLLIGVFFVILIIIVVVLSSGSSKVAVQSMQEEDIDTVAEIVAPIEIEAEISKKTWDIRTEKDEMTDSKNIWATLLSDNYIKQDFPYEGFTYAKITVRYMKKYGYDVLINITNGQIHGSKYSNENYIIARFDEGSPKKYWYDEAADLSSDVVFVRSKNEFIKKCKEAKKIKIEIPIYKGGRPVFSFEVDESLVWPDNK